jgi:hypothetical protein
MHESVNRAKAADLLGVSQATLTKLLALTVSILGHNADSHDDFTHI